MMLSLAWRTITLAALLIAITAVPARSQPYPNARTGDNYMHNYLLPPAASSSPMMNAAEDADMVSLQIANKDNRVLD